MPVPRLRGCTIRLPRSMAASSGGHSVHHSRCCWATMVHTRSGETTRSARAIASSSRECPPYNEQYCFGTEVPQGLVVQARSRLPSPPASTRDLTCRASGTVASRLETDVIVVRLLAPPRKYPANATGSLELRRLESIA